MGMGRGMERGAVGGLEIDSLEILPGFKVS